MARQSLPISFLFFLGILFLGSFYACEPSKPSSELAVEKDPYAYVFDHIQDVQAVDLLKKAIEAAGGLEAWDRVKEISFTKYFALYTESAAVEKEATQTYLQQTGKSKEDLALATGATDHQYCLLGNNLITIGGDINPDLSETVLRNSVLSASFVISIPFKLLDAGAQVSYAGTDKLDTGEEVEVLKVEYNPDEFKNHSTPDIWWHFFDAKTYKHLAYRVKHADHISYVENLSQVEAGGIVFPKKRKSWRVNTEGEKLWLRADYDYSDHQVKF